MAHEAGFTPQPVPPKILFPLLEGASFEDNEDLHTMWAALLANAADPNTEALPQPAFSDILKQLTPDQAKFLDIIYRETIRRFSALPNIKPHELPDPTMLDLFAISSPSELFALYYKLDVHGSDLSSGHSEYFDIAKRQELRRLYRLATDNLFRLRLLRERAMTEKADQREASPDDVIAEHFHIASGPRVFYFSTLGFEFIQACRPPKPKAQAGTNPA
jgi:hypothetical protein